MVSDNLPKITLVTPNYNYGRFIGAAKSVGGEYWSGSWGHNSEAADFIG